jgi:hypothetical protein
MGSGKKGGRWMRVVYEKSGQKFLGQILESLECQTREFGSHAVIPGASGRFLIRKSYNSGWKVADEFWLPRVFERDFEDQLSLAYQGHRGTHVSQAWGQAESFLFH